jgi:hypothetical protein
MRIRSSGPVAAIIFAACTATVPTTRGQQAPDDSSRSVAGAWQLEFRLDSIVSRDTGTPHWQPASFRTVTGKLVLGDSIPGRKNLFRSHIDIAFDALLGHPMSCFDPRPTETSVERDGDRVRLRFTPNAFDCGFGASGVLSGDSIVGTWDETSFAGPVAMGRFRMRRGS